MIVGGGISGLSFASDEWTTLFVAEKFGFSIFFYAKTVQLLTNSNK